MFIARLNIKQLIETIQPWSAEVAVLFDKQVFQLVLLLKMK